jgi:hypothetical protein
MLIVLDQFYLILAQFSHKKRFTNNYLSSRQERLLFFLTDSHSSSWCATEYTPSPVVVARVKKSLSVKAAPPYQAVA